MKCQRCANPATSHITEVLPEDRFEELHFCEGCAQKYLAEPATTDLELDLDEPAAELAAAPDGSDKQCEACGVKFVEFRNSGRLGCPHDYDSFRDDLMPLLESIHGEARHQGKRPRRRPSGTGNALELAGLRKKLQQAVTDEAYEVAADLRDQIKDLEDL